MRGVWLAGVLAVGLNGAVPAAAQDVRILTGHGGPIMDATISPDGTRALTASFDNSVGYWDLGNDTVTWLEGHEAAVKRVRFLGNGSAASSGDDFAIEIWNLETGIRKHRLEGHQGQVTGLAVSPDGKLLASASWDGTVGLWDLSSGQMRGSLSGHSGAVNDVAFTQDGRSLFSASADGTIRRWSVENKAIQRTVVRHGFGVTRLILNEEQRWLAYGAVDGGTRVISLDDDATVADLTQDRRPILALAASPDMSQIAVGDGHGYIMVVDTDGWTIRHDFRAARRGPIWALAYTADGAALLAGGIDDEAYFWPLENPGNTPLMATRERGFLRDPASMTNGERQFRRKCSICHSLTADSGRRAGPTLHRLFGRKAGSLPGYSYSKTMVDLDIVWSETTIDSLFDLGPDHFVPGSKMPMQRITRPEDRSDLIRFLKENTKG